MAPSGRRGQRVPRHRCQLPSLNRKRPRQSHVPVDRCGVLCL